MNILCLALRVPFFTALNQISELVQPLPTDTNDD